MQCLDRLPLQSPMGSQQLLLLLFLLLQLLLRANAEQPRPLNDEVLASQSSGAAAAGAAKQQEAAAAGSLQRAHDSDTAAASHAAAAIAEAAPAAAPEAAGAAAAAADAAADAAAAQAVEKLLRGQQRLPLTYSNVLQLLPQLQRRYPHLIRVRDAVKAFGLQDQLGGLRCGRESCRVPYLEVGLRSQLNRSTPAIFYSGLVHGDEVVGPTASVYLAALLASQFDKLEEVRLVGAAFERYLFIGGITWHGGMRAIARPWGSYDHSEAVSGGYRSRPAPDESGEVCILMFGEFDKSWTETVRGADPPLPPQSWLAQSRKGVSTGRAPKGSAILKGERQWIFPTRSPTFPGNGSPVGFTVNIRADGVEGFVSLSLPLPARQEQNGRDGDTPERAATQVQLSLLVGGFLNDAPIIFNPYTRILDPHRTAAQQQEHLQQEQQQQQPAFGATRAAADVQLGVHPGLSRLPEGLLLLQIERLDPAYTGSSSSSRPTWLPAAAAARLGSASAAAAATAAAAAAGEPPLGTSAAAPLAGSQHVPLLSDQVNEDFVRFLLHRLKLSKTRPSAAAAAAAVTEGLDLFFPYARSFACAFSSFLLLPEKPSFSLNRHNDNRRLSGNVGAAQRGSLGDRDRDRGQAPSLTGKLDVSSVWTKPHSGVTSLVGEFTAQEDFDFPLLLQFAERCCLDLLLHRQANGWALRAAFSILNCACGPGTVVKATLLPSTAASRSSSSSSSLGPDEELSGARVCSAEEAAAAAAAAAGGEAPVVTAYGVYGESPEQRIRVLQQLQQQQQGGEGQQLTPHEVAATVRRVAGVKGVVLIGTQGLEIEGGGLLSLEHLRTQAAKGAFLGVLLWGLVLLASLLFILSAGVLAWKRLGRHVHFAAAAAAAAGVFNGRLGRSCRAAPPYQVLGARPAEYAADGGDSLALPGPAAAPPTAAAPAAAATVL
ncbi:hypothetical protein Esti_004837 [Eimeria stiedai]